MSGRSSLADVFAEQARACEALGSPLYASLLGHCVEDIDAGGPIVSVLAGHEQDPGPSALALRLLGSVHRLVLDGALPELAAHYPSVGGDGDPEAAWRALHRALGTHAGSISPLMGQPPQTNEVGRSGALIGGLLHVAARFGQPVDLHEIGASAGLNLLADRFCYLDDRDRVLWGDRSSPVRLRDAWRGPRPPLDAPLAIAGRVGSDLAPLDATTDDGSRRLLAYVWPDMTERLARTRAAIELARASRPEVDRLDAAAAVDRIRLLSGRAVVLWHSVMWQYLPAATQQTVILRLERLGADATQAAPLVHLFLEPTRRAPGRDHEFLVVLRTWPGERRVIGVSVGHGLPVTWE